MLWLLLLVLFCGVKLKSTLFILRLLVVVFEVEDGGDREDERIVEEFPLSTELLVLIGK